MSGLTSSEDTAPADWIVAALRTFGESVLSLVPGGFPRYVRVFHPAYRFDPQSPDPWGTRTPVRWAEVAATNGTHFHAGAQWLALTGSYAFFRDPQPGVYDHRPAEGSLPPEAIRPL